MPTVKARYLGDLRVECQHVASGATLVTDAPVDNNGKGRSFSPTDLACTALATCAMTIMGIAAQKLDLDVSGTTLDITKIMSANPRRIARIEIIFNIAGSFQFEQKQALQQAVEGCPVCLSMSPETEQVFTFNWLE